MKLREIKHQQRIYVDAEKMWRILSHYGEVSRFHAGVLESRSEQGSDNLAAPGCERICHIVDLGLHISLHERIVAYKEGESYTYEVYRWKNFPLRKMLFSFRIIRGDYPGVDLEVTVAFKAKPAILTPLLAIKMRQLVKDVLLGYKHYAETGEQRVPVKQLKKQYQNAIAQILISTSRQ